MDEDEGGYGDVREDEIPEADNPEEEFLDDEISDDENQIDAILGESWEDDDNLLEEEQVEETKGEGEALPMEEDTPEIETLPAFQTLAAIARIRLGGQPPSGPHLRFSSAHMMKFPIAGVSLKKMNALPVKTSPKMKRDGVGSSGHQQALTGPSKKIANPKPPLHKAHLLIYLLFGMLTHLGLRASPIHLAQILLAQSLSLRRM